MHAATGSKQREQHAPDAAARPHPPPPTRKDYNSGRRAHGVLPERGTGRGPWVPRRTRQGLVGKPRRGSLVVRGVRNRRNMWYSPGAVCQLRPPMNIFLQDNKRGEGDVSWACSVESANSLSPQRAPRLGMRKKNTPRVVGRFVGAGRVTLLAVGFHDHGRDTTALARDGREGEADSESSSKALPCRAKTCCGGTSNARALAGLLLLLLLHTTTSTRAADEDRRREPLRRRHTGLWARTHSAGSERRAVCRTLS